MSINIFLYTCGETTYIYDKKMDELLFIYPNMYLHPKCRISLAFYNNFGILFSFISIIHFG